MIEGAREPPKDGEMRNLNSSLARLTRGRSDEKIGWLGLLTALAGGALAVRFIAVGIGLLIWRPLFFDADAALCFAIAFVSLILGLCGLSLMFGARRFLPLVAVFWIGLCTYLYSVLRNGTVVNRPPSFSSNRTFDAAVLEQYGYRAFGLAIAVAIFTYVAIAMFAPRRDSNRVASALFDESGKVRWNKLLVVLAIAIVAGTFLGDGRWIFDSFGQFFSFETIGDAAGSGAFGVLGAWILGALMIPVRLVDWTIGLMPEPQLVVPMLIVLAWVTARLQLTEKRIRIWVFGLNLLRVPFERIKRCDLIFHNGNPDTAVIRARLLGFIPITFGIHAKHWQNGNQIVDQIRERCSALGITIGTWRSRRWTVWAAYGLIACGAVVALIHELSYVRLWQPFFSPQFDMNNYWQIAAVGQTTVMTLVPVVLIGCGLGMLSAYHRAATRPYLMMLWMLIALGLPTPLLHWLIWMAIYAIYTAMLGIHQHAPTPNMIGWQNSFVLLSLVPAFAGASYLLGCIAGCRRIDKRPQEVGVPAELPRPVQSAKGGAVSHVHA